LSDRIVIMENGRISAIGTYKELENNKHLQKIVALNQSQREQLTREI
jgi:hypothetical protein